MAAGTGQHLMGAMTATHSTQNRGWDMELGWHDWLGAKGLYWDEGMENFPISEGYQITGRGCGIF